MSGTSPTLPKKRAIPLCTVLSSIEGGDKTEFVSRMVSRARVRPSARSFFTPDSGQVLAPDTTGASK
jgi:hypothetical protein